MITKTRTMGHHLLLMVALVINKISIEIPIIETNKILASQTNQILPNLIEMDNNKEWNTLTPTNSHKVLMRVWMELMMTQISLNRHNRVFRRKLISNIKMPSTEEENNLPIHTSMPVQLTSNNCQHRTKMITWNNTSNK